MPSMPNDLILFGSYYGMGSNKLQETINRNYTAVEARYYAKAIELGGEIVHDSVIFKGSPEEVLAKSEEILKTFNECFPRWDDLKVLMEVKR